MRWWWREAAPHGAGCVGGPREALGAGEILLWMPTGPRLDLIWTMTREVTAAWGSRDRFGWLSTGALAQVFETTGCDAAWQLSFSLWRLTVQVVKEFLRRGISL